MKKKKNGREKRKDSENQKEGHCPSPFLFLSPFVFHSSLSHAVDVPVLEGALKRVGKRQNRKRFVRFFFLSSGQGKQRRGCRNLEKKTSSETHATPSLCIPSLMIRTAVATAIISANEAMLPTTLPPPLASKGRRPSGTAAEGEEKRGAEGRAPKTAGAGSCGPGAGVELRLLLFVCCW